MNTVRAFPVAVVESRWGEGTALEPVSVRPLFELLGALYQSNPAIYHYEMFSSKAGLMEIVGRICRKFPCLYIGCHGESKGLRVYNGEIVTAKELNYFINGSEHLKGIHISACKFITQKNVCCILTGNQSIRWISGYRKNADWDISAALDLLFLSHLLDANEWSGTNIKKVATQMKTLMPGACKKAGFSVYTYGSNGNIADLMRPEVVALHEPSRD